MVGRSRKKYTFIVTMNWRYMFSLHATINAAKHFGTDADFHILYWGIESEYIKKMKKAFPNTFWIPIDSVEGSENNDYFNAKYKYADTIKDQYDAMCVLDGDLFLCSNVMKLFDIARIGTEFKMITAIHVHSDRSIHQFQWNDYTSIVDRCDCTFADFPVFFNRDQISFINDWYDFTHNKSDNDERSHPLVAFNRAISKHYKKTDVIPLPGDTWVCDRNFWSHGYTVNDENELCNSFGRVYAIHNRWWKDGRAMSEIVHNQQSENLAMAVNNFNVIKSYMEQFNDMSPDTRVDNYVKGKFTKKGVVV